MIKEIKDAIASAIHKAYPACRIFDETVTQGIVPGSFLITLIASARAAGIGGKYTYDVTFAVQYFPEEDDRKNDCYAMIDSLDDILEQIGISMPDGSEGAVWRNKAEPSVIDDVLSYQVRYIVETIRPITGEKMAAADISSAIS